MRFTAHGPRDRALHHCPPYPEVTESICRVPSTILFHRLSIFYPSTSVRFNTIRRKSGRLTATERLHIQQRLAHPTLVIVQLLYRQKLSVRGHANDRFTVSFERGASTLNLNNPVLESLSKPI